MIIVHIIFLILAVLIALVLFCPFSVKVIYREEVTVKVGYLFPFLKVFPQKPKPEKKKKPKKKKAKKQSDQPKKEESKKSENPIVKYVKDKGLDGLLELLKALAVIVFKLVNTITDHLVVSKFDLDAVIVGGDPSETAMQFGYACSGVYPAAAFIERRVKKFRHNIHLYAGFTSAETKIYFVMKARIVPIFVVIAGVQALFRAIKVLAK